MVYVVSWHLSLLRGLSFEPRWEHDSGQIRDCANIAMAEANMFVDAWKHNVRCGYALE
jgi:hypothetical protein